MATIECCVSCGTVIPEGMQICPRCGKEGAAEYKTITKNGRLYFESRYFREVYGVRSEYFAHMKGHGLPYIHQDRNTWINKQDFFDYHSGLIGDDS